MPKGESAAPRNTWRLVMVMALYRLLFPIFFMLTLPSWLLRMIRRGGWREKFGERFGFYAKETVMTGAPLIYAVSVGEMMIGLRVARAWVEGGEKMAPVLATTTTTGMALARDGAPSGAPCVYHTIDFRFAARRFLEAFKPSVIAIVEATPWPNLLVEANRLGIPVVILNARVSPRSQRGYERWGWFLRPLFALIEGVFVGEEPERSFWIRMGVAPAKVIVTGNMKFDVVSAASEQVALIQGLVQNVFPNRKPILLGGSTFPGEERLLLEVQRQLKAKYPEMLLILVPRHVERQGEILRDASALGCHLLLRSDMERPQEATKAEGLLVNTTGELRAWYEVADAVFIGKSLLAKGGQNPIEPLVAGVRPLFGPFMTNFRVIAQHLIDRGLAIQVKEVSELPPAVDNALKSMAREETRRDVAKILAPHAGAVQRSVELLKRIGAQPSAKL